MVKPTAPDETETETAPEPARAAGHLFTTDTPIGHQLAAEVARAVNEAINAMASCAWLLTVESETP